MLVVGGYSKARGWRIVGPLWPLVLAMLVGFQGLVSLWAQLVRDPRLCFWRVYPKALGSIGDCLEISLLLWLAAMASAFSEHIGRDTWHVDCSCSDARVFA